METLGDTSLTPSHADAATPTDPVDGWLDRVTRRLAVDRELRLEVRQELRSHVEESAAEFRVAGRSDADALAEALRKLGDETELSDQLWRANRRRVRLRAAAAWAVRLLLPPAAAALIAFLTISGLTAGAIFYNIGSPGIYEPFPGAAQLIRRAEGRAYADAPQDVRLLLDQGGDTIAIARRLVQEHPGDHALYANYATQSLYRRGVVDLQKSNGEAYQGEDDGLMREPVRSASTQLAYTIVPEIDEPVLRETLAVLAEGERREPDNAFYPLLASSLLFSASTQQQEDPNRIHRLEGQPPELAAGLDRIIVTDPARHAEARAALSRAAGKPYFRTYAAELVRRKLEPLHPRRVADLLMRTRQEIKTVLPWLIELRNATYRSVAEAPDLAKAGRADEARRVIAEAKAIVPKIAADAEGINELFTAYEARGQVDAAEGFTLEQLGDASGARAAWTRYGAASHRARDVQQSADASEAKSRAGLIYSVIGGQWVDPARLDTRLMIRAERAALDSLAVGAISTVLTVLAAVYAVLAGLWWLRSRGDMRPARLGVGWRRIVRIVGLGVVLPVAVYLVYAHLVPLGARSAELTVMLTRLTVEYSLLALIVLVIVSTMTRRAVLARMAELRLPQPPSVLRDMAHPWVISVALAVAAAAVCLAVAFVSAAGVEQAVSLSFPKGLARQVTTPAVLAAWMFIAYAVVRLGWTAWRRQRVRRKTETTRAEVLQGALPAYGWVARAAFAPVMMAAVALGLLGVPLRALEASAVARAAADGQPVGYLGSLNRSRYRVMRDELLKPEPSTTQPASVDVKR